MALYTFDTGSSLLQARLGRLEDIAPYLLPGGNYAASQSRFAPVDSSVLSDGMIDLTNSGVIPIGSIPPFAVNSPFAIVGDTTNLKATIYWDGTNGSRVPLVKRADGTIVPVPPSSQVTIGLVASTWYGFLPFWNPNSSCTVGFAQGDAGTPQFVFAGGTGAAFSPTSSADAQATAVQMQNLQGHEALTAGFATFQMPAAGSTSGGAGGGGGVGRCVMLGTDIEPLGEIDANDMTTFNFPETDWFNIKTKRGKILNCTGNHPLYDADDGKTEAQDFIVGDWVITDIGMEKIIELSPFRRACTKQQVNMKYSHLFWANGFLSSNQKAELA